MLKKKQMRILASRVNDLRPPVENLSGLASPERAVWAKMVNAITGTVIKEEHIQEFRDIIGWASFIDSSRSLDAADKAKKEPIGATERPRLGDGSGDAALAIGEHAFYAGFEAGYMPLNRDEAFFAKREQAWSNYEPSEDIKELS